MKIIKSRKKVFSVILAIFVFLTNLSLNVFAITSDETANITITAPVAGELPSYSATIDNECFEIKDEDFGYIYDGITWYDWTVDSNIDYGDAFIEGHVYGVTILVNKAEGVELELLKAKVNGNNAELAETDDDNGNAYYIVSYIFGEKPESDDETANITITAPVAGELPSYSATIDNECFEIKDEDFGYVYNGVTWYDDTFDSNVDENDVFLEAHSYTVSFLVIKTEGCELELLKATVNGNEAKINETDEYYLVSYQYYIETDSQIISSVNIFHVSEPIPGYSFDYTVTLGGVGYKTKDINNNTTINGVNWYDNTTSSYVETTDACVEGHDYTAIIQLEAKDGYILLPETVNINGKEVGFSYEGTDVVAEIYFEYTDPNIKNIELTDIIIPVQGYEPDYTATTDSDKYTFADKNDAYFSNGIAWFDLTEGRYLEIGNDTFVGAHEYMIEIYLVPEYGYTFNLTSVTLNGEVVTDVWGAVGSRVVLYYTFDLCEAPIDISILVTTVGGDPYFSPFVELIDINTDEVLYEGREQSAPDYSDYLFKIDFAYPTQYRMRVTKEGCAERNYNITVSSRSYEFTAELFECGDVNMDGVIDASDYQAAVNLALDDAKVPVDTSKDNNYQKALADICEDGVIDVLDCFYLERKVSD